MIVIASAPLLLPLSISLTLRGAGAFTPLNGISPFGAAMGRALSTPVSAHGSRRLGGRWACAPATTPLGLALLLGGTATGLALNLRHVKDDSVVLCDATAGGLGDASGGITHRIGNVNELPGGLVTTEHFFSLPLRVKLHLSFSHSFSPCMKTETNKNEDVSPHTCKHTQTHTHTHKRTHIYIYICTGVHIYT